MTKGKHEGHYSKVTDKMSYSIIWHHSFEQFDWSQFLIHTTVLVGTYMAVYFHFFFTQLHRLELNHNHIAWQGGVSQLVKRSNLSSLDKSRGNGTDFELTKN